MNVANDQVTKLAPRRAASRPNFNVLMANGNPKSFENEFEKLETAAARPISEMVRQQSLVGIDRSKRSAIARFVAAQSFRTEAYRIGFSRGAASFDLGTAMDFMMADIDQLGALLDIRKWALMVTDQANPFFLGDNPVVLQNTEHPGDAGELGLDMAGVEVFIPLSSVCALYMICPNLSAEIVKGYRNALRINVARLSGVELPDFEVSNAFAIAKSALVSAGPLYDAIVNGRALIVDEGNVENLNYLQCAWASSSVFSNQLGFEFAKRVFRENPQYRNVMPVRLHQIDPTRRS